MIGRKAVMTAAVLLAVAWAGAAFAAGGMVEEKGKLYVVSGTNLVVVDLKTLEVVLKKDLTKLGADPKAEEETKKRREEWIARYDDDKDGEINGEEINKSRWLPRMDRNQDGKVTVDELTIYGRPAPGASGAAELLVEKEMLIMLRGGMIFILNLADLELKGTVKVSEQQAPRMPMGGATGRGGQRGGRGGQRGGGARPGGGDAGGGGGANPNQNEGAF